MQPFMGPLSAEAVGAAAGGRHPRAADQRVQVARQEAAGNQDDRLLACYILGGPPKWRGLRRSIAHKLQQSSFAGVSQVSLTAPEPREPPHLN